MKISLFLDTRRGNDTFPLYVSVYDTKTTLINTGFRLRKEHFPLSKKTPRLDQINKKISEITSEVKLNGTARKFSFLKYVLSLASQYEHRNQIAWSYKLNSLYKDLRSFKLSSLSPHELRRLDQFFIANGNSPNTRHKKFKTLRLIYEQATKEYKLPPNPFLNVKIRTVPSLKEKLTKEDIIKLENATLEGQYDVARNMFLFSYYTQGTRFSDCLFARRSQVSEDRIYFVQSKTGKRVSVRIHPKLRALMGEGDYIFPYIKLEPKSETDRLHKTGMYNVIVNRNLKIIALSLGIKPFSFHQARHTFATLLRRQNVDIEVIKTALGHSSVRETEIYLKSLDDSDVDLFVEKLYQDNGSL